MEAVGKVLRRVQWVIGRLSVFMGALGSLCIIVITIAMLAEVVGRYVFGHSFLGVVELVEMLMAFIFFALLSYTQLLKGHLRLSLFIDRLPPRILLPLEAVVLLMVLALFCLMAWQAWSEAIYATVRNQIRFGAVEYPVWPAMLAGSVALSVMVMQVLADFVDRQIAVVSKDTPASSLGLPTSEADSV